MRARSNPTICLLGDVMLGRSVGEALASTPTADVWSPGVRDVCADCFFAQLVEAPRLFVLHRPPRPRRRGARAARSSKRLRTCSNSRARFLAALSELAGLVFLRVTGTSRVFPAA